MDALDSLEDRQFRERFDTGIRKIRHEIKSLLAHHGLFGTITDTATGAPNSVPETATVEIEVKGVTSGRLFDRRQIEGCCLRVAGGVLSSLAAMVDEVSARTSAESAGGRGRV
jgi:hypothetical protein